MSNRVTMFSTVYPSYHPKKGLPTHFVEQILCGLIMEDLGDTSLLKQSCVDVKALDPDRIKYHTIRAGSRFKAGDFMLPRIWTGKPYRSKQFQFAPPIEIKKVWNFEMKFLGEGKVPSFHIDNKFCNLSIELSLAKYDGFKNLTDFVAWFNKPTTGQIIAWNENLNY